MEQWGEWCVQCLRGQRIEDEKCRGGRQERSQIIEEMAYIEKIYLR